MNKKGQMNPQESGSFFNGVNPLLPVGIFLFVIPFLSSVVPFLKHVSWLKGVGIVCIIIGAVLSMFKSN